MSTTITMATASAISIPRRTNTMTGRFVRPPFLSDDELDRRHRRCPLPRVHSSSDDVRRRGAGRRFASSSSASVPDSEPPVLSAAGVVGRDRAGDDTAGDGG